MEENNLNTSDTICLLYNKYLDDLYIYGQNLGFNKDIIMDAIHDVFCRLCTNEGSIIHINNPKFYIFRALKNRLIEYYKLNKGSVFIDTNHLYVDRLPFTLQVTIEEQMIDKEEQIMLEQKINNILNILTNRQREFIYLKFIHNYSYDEISQLMGITIPACYKLYYKILRKLKKQDFDITVFLLFIIPTI